MIKFENKVETGTRYKDLEDFDFYVIPGTDSLYRKWHHKNAGISGDICFRSGYDGPYIVKPLSPDVQVIKIDPENVEFHIKFLPGRKCD